MSRYCKEIQKNFVFQNTSPIQIKYQWGHFFVFSTFCVRVRVGFEPRKLQNKQKKMLQNTPFHKIFIFKVVLWMQRSCNVLKYSFDDFIYALSWVLPLLINEVDNFFGCLTSIQHAKTTLCFFKACLFSSLAGGQVSQFWTDAKQRKTRNGLNRNKKPKVLKQNQSADSNFR
jgi:hypothetical protein